MNKGKPRKALKSAQQAEAAATSNAQVKNLHEVLKSFLPVAAFMSESTTCKETGKSFSVQKKDGDIVRYMELKEPIQIWPDWPPRRRCCDGLFVCGQKKSEKFLVLFVELKGGDTKKAMQQLHDTAKLFCRHSSFQGAGHGMANTKGYTLRESGFHHNRQVLAAIVSQTGGRAAPIWASEQKKLRQEGIVLLGRQPPQQSLTVADLFKLARY